MDSVTGIGRRKRLALGLAVSIVCALMCTGAGLTVAGDERAVTFYNIHTKETLNLVFKRDGKFVPEALAKFNHFMRDWRRNVETRMDPSLLDLIWDMHRELGSRQPVNVISGFRSPATNERLRRSGGGQAKQSRHMTGQAIDLQFPDVPVKQLRYSALIRERGGVGYYPTSAMPFVHVDTGNVRTWPRLPRMELAQLYPSGSSKYIPADGRPITKADFRMAVADLKAKGAELPMALQRHLNVPQAQPRTMMASLGPTLPASAPQPAPAAPPAMMAAAPPAAPRPEPEVTQPAPVAFTPQPQAPQDYSGKLIASVQQRPSSNLGDDQMVRAPDYDDDHPDELNYQPVPILPLLTETSLAYVEFSSDSESARKVSMLAEPAAALNIRLEPGPQYEGMYWAHRFTGRAVSGVLTKFAPNGGMSSTAAKTSGNASAH